MSGCHPAFIVCLLLACHLPLEAYPLCISLVRTPLLWLQSFCGFFLGILGILSTRGHSKKVVGIHLIKRQSQGRLVRRLAELVLLMAKLLLRRARKRQHPARRRRCGKLLQALLERGRILCGPVPLGPAIEEAKVVDLALPREALFPVWWQFGHLPLCDVGSKVDVELATIRRGLQLPAGRKHYFLAVPGRFQRCLYSSSDFGFGLAVVLFFGAASWDAGQGCTGLGSTVVGLALQWQSSERGHLAFAFHGRQVVITWCRRSMLSLHPCPGRAQPGRFSILGLGGLCRIAQRAKPAFASGVCELGTTSAGLG
mmetsp:Transcript_19168/g.45009  ORF Transcript_19168/g.45009 Transcript_19168/m.45009 type:complete len:312 (-) Transcript_19168:6097-7032(-)